MVTDREYEALTVTVREHEARLRLLERDDDEQRGAAREGARTASRVVAAVGIIGMFGQFLIGLHYG